MRHSDHFPADSSASNSGSGGSGPQERPGDPWLCGHFDSGSPCTHGPTAEGRCPVRGPCQPAARPGAPVGESFRCTRPPCSGGPCPMRPEPDGTCGMMPAPCRPRRSWHGRSRLAVRVAAAGSIVVLVVAVLGPWRQEVFAPGPLSGPHAQILGSQGSSHNQANNDRCAACHTVARSGLAAWFRTGGAGHAGVTQTQLCIECHHATIRPERAMAAHNLTAEELRLMANAVDSAAKFNPLSVTQVGRRELTWHDSMPRPSFARDQVECAACHREHGGQDADITWMSSAQCQTCHQDRFASFAAGHPDWQAWPYGRGGQIAFNHATHQGDHFAKEGKTFDCQACHAVTTAGEIARAGSFESTCASCHDRSLRLQTGQGIALVALPMLDIDAVREAGLAVPPWPAGASGIDAVTIAPLTRMLLSSDPAVAAAIEELTAPTANLWQGPPSPTRLRATATVAQAIHTLIDSLADDLGGEVEGRLHTSDALGILGQLSPQLIATARDRWFPPSTAEPGDEATRDPAAEQGRNSPVSDSAPLQSTDQSLLAPPQDDLLLSDPLLSDPLLSDPQLSDPLLSEPLAGDLTGAEAEHGLGDTAAKGERFDPERKLPAGGWYRDDVRMAIRYRGSGSPETSHADPVLRAVVELATSLAAADRESLLKLPAVAACIDCHSAVRRGEVASWRAVRDDAERRTFTRFSHRPHLHLPALSDCTHCHAVSGSSGGAATLDRGLTTASFSSEPMATAAMPEDFAPLSHATCVECHTPQAAGDSCTQCHRYHVDPSGPLSPEENRGADSTFIPR